MFKEIGKKIKGLAKILFVLGIIISVICGIASCTGIVGTVTIASGADAPEPAALIIGIIAFLIVLLVGILISYLSVLFTYAFGELVDKVDEIEKKIGTNKNVEEK